MFEGEKNDTIEMCIPYNFDVEGGFEVYTWNFFLLFWMVLRIGSKINMILAMKSLKWVS